MNWSWGENMKVSFSSIPGLNSSSCTKYPKLTEGGMENEKRSSAKAILSHRSSPRIGERLENP